MKPEIEINKHPPTPPKPEVKIMTRLEYEQERTKRIAALATTLSAFASGAHNSRVDRVLELLEQTSRENYFSAIPEANKWTS